jgi:hypothetical protein
MGAGRVCVYSFTVSNLAGSIHMYTPYIHIYIYIYGWPEPYICTVYLVISLSNILYINLLYVGLAKTIYIRCIYGNFGREITKYTVIYGVYIRFWPTLVICGSGQPYTYNHKHHIFKATRLNIVIVGSGFHCLRS